MATLYLICYRAHHKPGASTSNLRKDHVTRDSSGPATLAISAGLQQ